MFGFHGRKDGYPDHSQKASCQKGCGRPAFGSYPTCCTRCQGPSGPHAADCAEKAGLGQEAANTTVHAAGGKGKGRGKQGAFRVVLRVIKAQLFRSFDTVGKMDPFCMVKFNETDLGRTNVARQEHMTPHWDYAFPEKSCKPEGTDLITFNVSEQNMRGMLKDTFCGEVTVSVADLLGDALVSAAQGRSREAPIQEIKLVKRGEHTGNLQVQAVVVTGSGAGAGDVTATCVNPEMFESPVERVGVSGGTAPFFTLKLRRQFARPPHRGERYFIGKDLSRARDELDFYERLLKLSRTEGQGGFGPILKFMLEYEGIFKTTEMDAKPDEGPLELLVMRNLFDGCKKLRLLDLKIGGQTAAAGWQGKSRVAAWRQSLVDCITNSSKEGYRLEGFDGMPKTLASQDPLLDVKESWEHMALPGTGESIVGAEDGKTHKKAARMLLQRMNANSIFMLFIDLHKDLEDPENANISTRRSQLELSELVLQETAIKLVELAVACRRLPVPQKWIGSSVALGFDCGQLPERAVPEADIRARVKVHIFDWGRSELNTLEHHLELSKEDQEDRTDFWRKYKEGLDRLAFNAVSAYWDRFNHTGPWQRLVITVHDYDSHSQSDFLGELELPLEETPEKEFVLLDRKKKATDGRITLGIRRRTYPKESSRLKEAWLIHIVKAKDLPALDRFPPKSDPFCQVQAFPADKQMGVFEHETCVVKHNCDPVWDEVLEVPTVYRAGLLDDALETVCPVLQPGIFDELRTSAHNASQPSSMTETMEALIGISESEADKLLAAWSKYLDDGAREKTSFHR